jgi:hypothetical protein
MSRGYHPHMPWSKTSATGGPKVGTIRRLQRYSEAGVGVALSKGDHRAIAGLIGMSWSKVKNSGKYTEGSKAFIEAVGNDAAKVMNKTQVSTSMVDRSQIGMASDPITAVVGMFFGAREKVLNQYRESVIRIQRGMDMKGEAGRKEVIRGAKGLVGTIGFGLGSVAMIDLLRHVMRRPDDFKGEDGQMAIEKVMTALVSQMIDTTVGTLPGSDLGLTAGVAAMSPFHDAKTRRLYAEWQGDHPAWSMVRYPIDAANSMRKLIAQSNRATDLSLSYKERKEAKRQAEIALSSMSKSVEGTISEFLGIPVYQVRRLWATGNIFRDRE